MSRFHRKPKVFLLDKNIVLSNSLGSGNVEDVKSGKDKFVPGDCILGQNCTFLYINGRCERIGSQLEISIPKQYQSITNDAVNYFSDVYNFTENNSMFFGCYLSLEDKSLQEIGSYYRQMIEVSRIHCDKLTIKLYERPAFLDIRLSDLTPKALEQTIEQYLEPCVSMVVVDYDYWTHKPDFPKDVLYYAPCRELEIGSTFVIEQTTVQGGNNVRIMCDVLSHSKAAIGAKLLKEKFSGRVDVLCVTEPFRLLGFEDFGTTFRVVPGKSPENIRMKKSLLKRIVDICLSLYPLDLEKYVLLWIVDWVPHIHFLCHRQKIALIFSVYDSCQKVIEMRKKI